jgi:outer membrane protein assembly factor BamB
MSTASILPPRRSRPISLFALGLAAALACSTDWPAFRHDGLRTAALPENSPLADPLLVPSLAVRWAFPASGARGAFRASPVVWNGRVFAGSSDGHLYALDMNTGAQLWQYPPPGAPALLSHFTCNPSSEGIGSSAVVTSVGGKDAVIFAAPDPSVGTTLGEGRLFALDASSGAELWKSPVAAHLTGTTGGSTSELHEQIGYSSPLVFDDHVYVGIADHCDNPIQKGRVASFRLADGSLESGFSFCATGACGDATRGGGAWSSLAGNGDSVYVTTGNVRAGQGLEPAPNRGLSMLRLDKSSGAVVWQFQPVPWVLDGDPDWSATVSYQSASCGAMMISTQKDGWTHAVAIPAGRGGAASKLWSFPPHATPFSPADGTSHGDSRYMRSGAAWGDVYVTLNGGLNLTASGVTGGLRRLHAFNVCSSDPARLRWLLDVPGTTPCAPTDTHCYRVGHPSVTRGMIYVGTDQGHVLAIADPSISPAAGFRCANPDVPTASCVLFGYSLVPQPAVLANVALPDAGRIVYSEPALARGKVFVATEAGHVYMLSPSPPARCGGGPVNACGGCTTLFVPPGGGCEDRATGKCGRNRCVGTDAVTCDTSDGLTNACGGCGLMGLPGTGHGRGDQCICNDPAQEDGILVCSADKNHLICCPCTGPAPGCR